MKVKWKFLRDGDGGVRRLSFSCGLLLLKAIYVIPIGSFMVMGALFFTIATVTIWTTMNFSILVVFGVNNIN